MFLEKLEIHGFKSFAGKYSLVFPGVVNGSAQGMTAIVGPNGSGKSNIADAVRWALGEQSMKSLRGKKSEDIIFSGSGKKARLSLAEVTMHFNNEDGRAPIDYRQFTITRRLYRDGESEYLLNGQRVRLMDIELLLAKANVGQKTYSVVGQGTVEGFLSTSLADRKEFFDEATGVKQFQIKRDDSLNKLRLSLEHLGQAEMLVAEVEPRLQQLTRQVGRLRKRGQLEVELKDLQLAYYRSVWHELNDHFTEGNKKLLELDKAKQVKDKKLAAVTAELVSAQRQAGAGRTFDKLQQELSSCQAEKERLGSELATVNARLELSLEKAGKFDLAFFRRRQTELTREEARLGEEVEVLSRQFSSEEKEVLNLEKERQSLSSAIAEAHNKLGEDDVSGGNDYFVNLKNRLKKTLEILYLAENANDTEGIKSALRDLRQELTELHDLADRGGSSVVQRSRAGLMALTDSKEEILEKLRLANRSLAVSGERLRLLKESRQSVVKELTSVSSRLKEDSGLEPASLEVKKELERAMAESDKVLAEIRTKLNAYTAEQENERQQLFTLQNSQQALQGEVNELSSELNEARVDSARYETKLEDLEVEIRQQLGGLKEVRETRLKEDVDRQAARDKIASLKRQLELIGGLDPEIENEYLTTKERYDFLTGQINDLMETGQSLEKVVEELDMVIKERFDKAFAIIAKKFQEYFKILFDGGQAGIVKVMVDDPSLEENNEEMKKEGEVTHLDETLAAVAESEVSTLSAKKLKRIKFLQKHNATGLAGIEITACPPGKKIMSISMLSGGERALTAIALIAAIISANPSPFVVLDEVDAALDEANSERLAKVLDDLSHKTQFIVITHNRASMVRASVLYGVSMQDDGVSKLLSITLEEAKFRNA
ncbi:MAG: AAA family ATPase [Patescibacteria group bacterium]|nr:MAG: AAA family ATPase [Patescibacteria group bacterium]